MIQHSWQHHTKVYTSMLLSNWAEPGTSRWLTHSNMPVQSSNPHGPVFSHAMCLLHIMHDAAAV